MTMPPFDFIGMAAKVFKKAPMKAGPPRLPAAQKKDDEDYKFNLRICVFNEDGENYICN